MDFQRTMGNGLPFADIGEAAQLRNDIQVTKTFTTISAIILIMFAFIMLILTVVIIIGIDKIKKQLNIASVSIFSKKKPRRADEHQSNTIANSVATTNTTTNTNTNSNSSSNTNENKNAELLE